MNSSVRRGWSVAIAGFAIAALLTTSASAQSSADPNDEGPPTTAVENDERSAEGESTTLPDGFGEPVTLTPPSGTPFDDFEPPKPEPLNPPQAWEIEQATELRTDLGFSVEGLDRLFDASVADPESPEALSRDSTGTPMSADEFAEFERRMSMGEAQGELVLKAQEVIGFAGNFIDHSSGGTQVLAFTEDADQEAISQLVASYEHPRYLRIDVAEQSVADLAKARDGAFAAMEATELVEGEQWALYTDFELNTVVLEYVDAAKEPAAEVAERFGVQAISFGGYIDEVDCTDTNCLPLSGGTNTGGGTGGCTWGYVVIANGLLRVSTAGHCADASGDATRTWNGMTLTRNQFADSGPVDFAIYDIPLGTWATNDLYRSDSGSNRFGLQVESHRNPQQNDTVCKRGRTTNWTCGTVSTAAVGELARASYRSCPGDSGAPVSIWASNSRRAAVGTHTNGVSGAPGCDTNPVVPGAGTRRFMMDQYISSNFGHTVYTDTNVRRDFAISLYDRALDRAPDLGGLIFWQTGSCNTTGLGSMSTAFFTGAEFKAQPLVNDVNNQTELRRRFERLYRGTLRRAGSYSERQGWVNWVHNNAGAYPGSSTTAKRENAYNAAAAYFGASAEFLTRFSTGGDGEIPLCSN